MICVCPKWPLFLKNNAMINISTISPSKTDSGIRLPELLDELAISHGEGTFEKLIKSYQKVGLLIVDEFLLTPLSSDQARELLEIIEARGVKGSVIFCTQFEPGDWYNRIGTE